jgi:rubrerythrin
MNTIEIKYIKQAIMKEVRAYEFYKMAAREAKDDDIRQAFLTLSEEEMQHVEWLHNLFNKIKEDALDDYALASIDVPDSEQLLKWDKIKGENLDLLVTVFGIAIDMEKSSVEFYKKAMEESEIGEAKKLFKILAKWEETHMAQFSKDYQNLQDEWWATQSFAPF